MGRGNSIQGFGLIEVLMTVGALSVGAIATLSLVELQNRSTATLTRKVDHQRRNSQLLMALQEPQACARTLQQSGVISPPSNETTRVQVQALRLGGQTLAAVGQPGNGYAVRSMALQILENLGQTRIETSPGVYTDATRILWSLQIESEDRSSGPMRSFGSATTRDEFLLLGSVSPTGDVLACSLQSSMRDICERLIGGVYRESPPSCQSRGLSAHPTFEKREEFQQYRDSHGVPRVEDGLSLSGDLIMGDPSNLRQALVHLGTKEARALYDSNRNFQGLSMMWGAASGREASSMVMGLQDRTADASGNFTGTESDMVLGWGFSPRSSFLLRQALPGGPIVHDRLTVSVGDAEACLTNLSLQNPACAGVLQIGEPAADASRRVNLVHYGDSTIQHVSRLLSVPPALRQASDYGGSIEFSARALPLYPGMPTTNEFRGMRVLAEDGAGHDGFYLGLRTENRVAAPDRTSLSLIVLDNDGRSGEEPAQLGPDTVQIQSLHHQRGLQTMAEFSPYGGLTPAGDERANLVKIINGTLQIQDALGSEGEGKVLTSDGSGKARWELPQTKAVRVNDEFSIRLLGGGGNGSRTASLNLQNCQSSASSGIPAADLTTQCIGANQWSYCSIAETSFSQISESNDEATCRVTPSGGAWILTATVEDDAKILRCRASCFRFE
jgi:hypothetical protein